MTDLQKYTLQVVSLLATIMMVGTLGYYFIEDGWTLSDAFYMTVITITTVGFGEIHELSQTGRMFTVLLVFTGFSAVGLFATQFARLVIGNELFDIITQQKIQKKLMNLTDHYIICGYNEIASALCNELKNVGTTYVVIELDAMLADRAENDGCLIVRGNATSDESLKKAGIERSAGLVSVLANDADNLFIALAARELNPRMFIIARGEEAEIEDRILRAGADMVVSPMNLGGRQIARVIMNEASSELSVQNDDRAATEVLGFSLRLYRPVGDDIQSVAKAVRAAGAVQAIAIRHDDGTLLNHPADDVELAPDDSVVMVMHADSIPKKRLHKEPTGHKILLADDHRALRLLFSRKISAAGHEVIIAENGEEAVELARKHVPSLVVLDVHMPKLDGYGACEKIKQENALRDIPVILFSADEGPEFHDRGRQCGADSCLRKTSRSAELLSKIEEFIK